MMNDESADPKKSSKRRSVEGKRFEEATRTTRRREVGLLKEGKKALHVRRPLPLPLSRFPFPVSRFPFPDSRFPIPDSRFPLPASRFPIPDSRFPLPATRCPPVESLNR
jgi:hypothetical protein